SGANLALSNGGGSVTLPTGTTYTAGSGINIAGNAISATDASNTNEIQTITLSGANLSLSNGGGSVTLPTGTTYSAGSGISIAGNAISASDASATNELQTLSVNGNTMSITGGNTVNLPAGAAYTQGDGIILNGTEISAVDESATNELQTISILGNTISVSNGGNAVAIPNSWISVGGEHIVNPNAGNVAIDPLAFSIPTASLDVYRGTGLDGTAAFRGSVHSSHFNYATNEDTFIRAGKTSSNVYINDSHNGNVNIATGGGGVGIGVNSNLSYKAQLASNFGKGMRIDVSGTSATTPEGLTISMTSASSLNKYGLYGESSGLGTGGNFGVVGNAMGGASGYKIGVLGTANGTGLSAPSIGVQGVASSSSGSANFGLHGLAVTATTAANFGVYALASASSQGTSFVPNESLNGTAYPNNFHEIFSVYGDYDYLTPGNQGWAGFFNGDVYAYNVFYQSSDSTLKTNVQTIAHGLEAVKSLRPVSYQMKESAGRDSKFSDETSYGFIAQEVYDVLPELVTALVHPVDVKMHGDERALLALNYDGFIPVLTSAVQEQHGQMEALQQENKKLIEQLNAQASTNDWQTQELEELKREVEAFRVLVLQLSSTKK
ncbi:MAG: tail fiber domain-containing protein, partial [Flavobacteriales bacterium]|nr:tail fiber domain-containing protein [Flavobacteriales bacterium]